MYLAFSDSIGRGPTRVMDIVMVKQSSSNEDVVFITEVSQPFFIVIDDTYTVLFHNTIPARVTVPGSGIQASQHHQYVMCWELISHGQQLVVKSNLVCLPWILRWKITHNHHQLGIVCVETGLEQS